MLNNMNKTIIGSIILIFIKRMLKSLFLVFFISCTYSADLRKPRDQELIKINEKNISLVNGVYKHSGYFWSVLSDSNQINIRNNNSMFVSIEMRDSTISAKLSLNKTVIDSTNIPYRLANGGIDLGSYTEIGNIYFFFNYIKEFDKGLWLNKDKDILYTKSGSGLMMLIIMPIGAGGSTDYNKLERVHIDD